MVMFPAHAVSLEYIDDLVGKGLDGSVITELLLYASAGLVPMALPLATLFSSINGHGQPGENIERWP